MAGYYTFEHSHIPYKILQFYAKYVLESVTFLIRTRNHEITSLTILLKTLCYLGKTFYILYFQIYTTFSEILTAC